MPRSSRAYLRRFLIIGLLLVAVAGFRVVTSATLAECPQCIPHSFADIAEHIEAAVVNISSAHPVHPFLDPQDERSPSEEDTPQRFFGDEALPNRFRQRRSLGSGVLIDEAGYIVTNQHVIEEASEIRVMLANEEEFEAEIIGTDVKTDLALIKIEAEERTFPVVQLGDSDVLRVGDWVIAVGNPYGLSHTVTAGIVSAKGRVIGSPYDDFIQTDASINPGNSGGPLINIHGEVVGINTAIFATLQGNHFAQGIGFAIPVNIVSQVVSDLRRYQKVQRGWLGVMIQDMTVELADSFNLPNDRGALIANVVPGSPADKAGLKRGDVVLRFHDVPIEHSSDLPKMTAESLPGTTHTLTVNRDGKEMTLAVVLGEFPESRAFTSSFNAGETAPFGIAVRNLTPELRQELGLPDDTTGVLVEDVAPGSPGDAAQIRPGDVLCEINRVAIRTVAEYHQALDMSRREQMILVLLKREAEMLYTILKTDIGQ
jgi:serine protease Do